MYSLAECAKIHARWPYLGDPWDISLELFGACKRALDELM